jgi:hypothetical protein
MLSGQTNSLGRGYAAAPITDWFNSSTAHQYLFSLNGIFQTCIRAHGPDMGQTITALAIAALLAAAAVSGGVAASAPAQANPRLRQPVIPGWAEQQPAGAAGAGRAGVVPS